MSFFLEVFQSAFSPMVLFYMIAGVAAGICIGALPGLTATMGVALLLPLTFGMDATAGILMLLGIYVGAIYGGSISAILLHTPGTPASAATAIDGYQFSKRGEAGRALGIATLSSYVGGVVSVLCLWLISPQLAKLALKFSSAEFFLLAVFGLCIIANISGENMAKGLICGFLGILTATVGIDSVTSYIRFTDNANLLSGIQYIPVMIGLFAMSQAFETIEDNKTSSDKGGCEDDPSRCSGYGPHRNHDRYHPWCRCRYRILRWIQHRPRHVQTSGTVRKRKPGGRSCF